MVLAALPVGLQLWESAGDGGLALAWTNGDDDAYRGEDAARAALAGETVDTVEPYRDGFCRVRTQSMGDGRVLVSFEDVTELAAAERLSSSIVACLDQALIVVNTDGRITRSNDAAADLCGVSLGELTGSRLRDLPIKVFGRDGQPLDPTGSPIFRALAGDSVRSLLRLCAARGDQAKW